MDFTEQRLAWNAKARRDRFNTALKEALHAARNMSADPLPANDDHPTSGGAA